MASHKVAVVLQKFTWPVVTGVDPTVTVAVAVTLVFGATGLLPELKVNVVAVAV
jgi:hypothetical protein